MADGQQFDADPLDTRGAIKAAKRHIVAFDSDSTCQGYEDTAIAYAMLIAHEAPDWITKHRALDRFLDTLFRPFLTRTKEASKTAIDWFHLYTDPRNGILFSRCSSADSTLAFTNPTSNTLASLRTDWPPALQLASLTTAAHLARALAPMDRANAALYLAHAKSYLLAGRSLFPGCGKVDRLLAMLALAVRPPAPTHDVPPSASSERQQHSQPQHRPRGQKGQQHLQPQTTTVWATPTTREIDALYHLTCAQCAATDPSPDAAALDKLLQPVHEWDMIGPAAQALQARHRDHDSRRRLVLAPVSALLAWYCRLYTRTSLERVANLAAHVVASLTHVDADRQFKVAVIAMGLAFHLRTTPAVSSYALESLIAFLAFAPSSPSPTVWTALISRGILACPPSTLARVSTASLDRLATLLNKVRKSATATDTPEAHKWLSGLDPSLYPYPLTEPLDRAEVHSWWSAYLASGACPALAYDAANKRTPFTLTTTPAAAAATSTSTRAPDSPPVLVLSSATAVPPAPIDPSPAPAPPLYVFDTNTLLNHLSLLYQSTHALALPLAVMYELAGLQRAAERAVARHATMAWTAIVNSSTATSPAAAPAAAVDVQPASASIAIYTSRGSRLSVAQVIKGVSEDYRNRGGLDNVVLDTCAALAAAAAAAPHAARVVLVTDDLNLRLKAQGRGVRTCGVADVVPGGGDDKAGGLRVGEQVRFAGAGEAGAGRRGRGGGKPGRGRGNAMGKEDARSRRSAGGGEGRGKREGGQQSQPQQQGQGGRVWVPRDRRRGGNADSAVE